MNLDFLSDPVLAITHPVGFVQGASTQLIVLVNQLKEPGVILAKDKIADNAANLRREIGELPSDTTPLMRSMAIGRLYMLYSLIHVMGDYERRSPDENLLVYLFRMFGYICLTVERSDLEALLPHFERTHVR